MVGLAGGVDRDDERVHVARRAAGGQAEVAEVAARGGLEALHALDLAHLLGVDVGGPEVLVVVHERAKAHAQRARDLDERRERGRHLPRLEALDHLNVALAAVGQVLRRQVMRLAQRGYLLPQLVLVGHDAVPSSRSSFRLSAHHYPLFAPDCAGK